MAPDGGAGVLPDVALAMRGGCRRLERGGTRARCTNEAGRGGAGTAGCVAVLSREGAGEQRLQPAKRAVVEVVGGELDEDDEDDEEASMLDTSSNHVGTTAAAAASTPGPRPV